MTRCVIVIHGVGQTSPAEVGGVVADTLGYGTTSQTSIRHEQTSFLEFTSDASRDRVLEVHWADLMRPRATAFGILRHVWYIVTSMVDVALEQGSAGRSFLVRLYRWLLFPMTLGAGALALATAVAASVEDRWLRMTLLAALTFILLIAAVRLLRYGSSYRSLWPWAAAVALVTVLSAAAPLPVDSWWVQAGIMSRDVGFLVSVVVLTFAAAEIWIRPWPGDTDVRCALLALLYLPWVAMNSLMAWVGLLGLGGLALIGNHYPAWENAAYPDFDLGLFELGATVVFTSLGVLFIAYTAGGYARGRVGQSVAADAANGQFPAVGARDGFARFLQVAPLILLVLGVYSAMIKWGTTRPADTSIIEIYRVSVLRTLPFVAWLIGPFAIAADVAGDILFYLQPQKGHPAAIRDECSRRLAAVYDYATRRGDEVVVLAHSQGSKIAADLRAENKLPGALVTCGSPVTTLYERFLGAAAHGRTSAMGWVNAFRCGDYIGGSIPGAMENRGLGPGGHTDYWSDPSLPGLIETALASSNR